MHCFGPLNIATKYITSCCLWPFSKYDQNNNLKFFQRFKNAIYNIWIYLIALEFVRCLRCTENLWTLFTYILYIYIYILYITHTSDTRLSLSFLSSNWVLSVWPKFGTVNSLRRVTHICDSKLTMIGSDNGLSPDRRQVIIWTITGILLIRTSRTNFSEILSEMNTFSFQMYLKMSSKRLQFYLGLNALNHLSLDRVIRIMHMFVVNLNINPSSTGYMT